MAGEGTEQGEANTKGSGGRDKRDGHGDSEEDDMPREEGRFPVQTGTVVSGAYICRERELGSAAFNPHRFIYSSISGSCILVVMGQW